MKRQHSVLIFLISISLCLLIACQDKSQEKAKANAETAKKNDSLLQLPLRYPANEIKLSEKAQSEVENWMLYVAMEGEVKRMRDYTVEDVISNAPSILRASDTLIQTIPIKFRTKPIESRIKVLHTKASVLNQLAEKQTKDLEELKQVAEEVPVDFFNLNIQLNEIYIEMPDLETLEP